MTLNSKLTCGLTCLITCEAKKVNRHFLVHVNGPTVQFLASIIQLFTVQETMKLHFATSWKRNTAFLHCLFLQHVFLSSNVHSAGEEIGRVGSSRQGLPLETRGSETWSWRKRRQSSSGIPKSCWTKSSWPPGSRSSGLPAGARVPAEPHKRRKEKSARGERHFESNVER